MCSVPHLTLLLVSKRSVSAGPLMQRPCCHHLIQAVPEVGEVAAKDAPLAEGPTIHMDRVSSLKPKG